MVVFGGFAIGGYRLIPAKYRKRLRELENGSTDADET
jgi:hypothetical protein